LRRGHAAALRKPQVIKAIQGGCIGKIALAYVQWAGHGHIKTVVDWQIIKDKASAHAFVAKILAMDYDPRPGTGINDMILASIELFKKNDFVTNRRILDLSGDGTNNIGIPVTAARDRALRAGIVINGIPVLSRFSDGFKYRTAQHLDTYFQKCVIGGAGSFVVVANGYDEFARAIKRKMLLEIAYRPPTDPVADFALWP